MTVYFVQHVYDVDGCDHVTNIGIYSSEENAKAAVAAEKERGKLPPGTDPDFPDGFSIATYEIDRDHWAEGFFEVQ